MNINKRLTNARDYVGLTLESVAEIINLPLEYLTKIENGQLKPKTEDLEKLSKLYKHSIYYFLDSDYSFKSDVEVMARATSDLSDNDREHVMRFSYILSNMK
ncbi:helix-turn-helix domain-containing protein [Radiobacillus kanasensis]|uniref:helix-turn-helix domain-containing protein n=1 Tax=Radiobacillus kanasensis TaxID=2844358 RepID=UPI001E38B535|nr:helix-turn-helix transcriptional regulator [Radiobacillus kanasensis]UFT99373.1 helix-turn-helix domain-containing protein [Radiobacillus kanasensis]